MDFIDVLLKSHDALRGCLASAAEILGPPAGAGWDDRLKLDKRELSRRLGRLLAALDAHAEFEDDFLERIVRHEADERDSALMKEGRGHSIKDIVRLFGAIAGICDGEHVYRVRAVLLRLNEELEAHLAFEEKRVYPWLRERVPAPLLRELGQRALSRRRSGFLAAAACE